MLPILSLFSLIIIAIVYLMAVNNQNDMYTKALENPNSNTEYYLSQLRTGLVSNPLDLALTFLSLVPFIVFTVWYIFKSSLEDGSELVVMSKRIKRWSIVLQRFMITLVIIFVHSLLSFLTLYLVSNKDLLVSSSERLNWSVSMFIGVLISSIAIAAIVIVFSFWLKFTTLFLTTFSVLSILPIISCVMVSQEPNVSPDTFNDYYPYMEVDDKKPAHQTEGTGYNETHTLSYEATFRKELIYGHEPIKHYSYIDYAKNDSWAGVIKLFNIFNSNKTSLQPRGSWTDEYNIQEVINANPDSLIDIDGTKYIYNDNDFEHKDYQRKDGEHVVKTYGLDKWLLRDEDYDDPFGLGISGILSKEINVQNTLKNVDEFVKLLENNDSIARKYRKLSFAAQQCMFKEIYFNYRDLLKQPLTMFNEMYDKFYLSSDASKNVYDKLIDNQPAYAFRQKQTPDGHNYLMSINSMAKENGFYDAKRLLHSNEGRYMPSSLSPDDNVWHSMIEINGHPQKLNSLDKKVYKPHIKEELEVNTWVGIFWLILFLSFIPLSGYLYNRKDFS